MSINKILHNANQNVLQRDLCKQSRPAIVNSPSWFIIAYRVESMALVSVSANCFSAVEKALFAMKTGDSRQSAVVLKSIKDDGLLLQREASVLCDQLSKAEEDHKQKVEDLTRQMNELYVEETQLAKRKQELENRKTSLTGEKERCHRSKEEASRRYRVAQKEKREAEEKYDELKRWFWVPIYGTFLAVRELIEENEKKASDAYGEMKRFEREMERVESEISWANSEVFKVRTSLYCLFFLRLKNVFPFLIIETCFRSNIPNDEK